MTSITAPLLWVIEYAGRNKTKVYAAEALSLVLKFAKEWLRLRKVTARAFAINKASIRVLEKNGFELVGRLKEQQFVPDCYLHEIFITSKIFLKHSIAFFGSPLPEGK